MVESDNEGIHHHYTDRLYENRMIIGGMPAAELSYEKLVCTLITVNLIFKNDACVTACYHEWTDLNQLKDSDRFIS